MDVRKLVRKAERDPWNRLNSILEDADWVTNFCKSHAPHLPIIPNLRCGAWYVPQSLGKGCYFKSTDGHTSEWGFSLKRYNLDLIYKVQEFGGCVIVDSTRRGKSMSDALSKTIPIWCAVLNTASKRKFDTPLKATLHLPIDIVSSSEQEQIAAKLDGWVDDLLSSDLIVPKLDKPLRPLFVTRKEKNVCLPSLSDGLQSQDYTIVLLSASQMVPTPGLDSLQSPIQQSALNLSEKVEQLRREARYVYVQGSGDDEEMWSCKLTPQIFWQQENLHRILYAGKGGESIEATLIEIVASHHSSASISSTESDVQIGDFDIYIGSRNTQHSFTQAEREKYSLIIQADAKASSNGTTTAGEDIATVSHCRVMQLNIAKGKRGLKSFLDSLPQVTVSAILAILRKSTLLKDTLFFSSDCCTHRASEISASM